MMICASVPIWLVSSHLDETLGARSDAPATWSVDSLLSEVEVEAAADWHGPLSETVFPLTSLRRAAA